MATRMVTRDEATAARRTRPAPLRRQVARLAALLLLAVGTVLPARAADTLPSEYDVKASLIVTFMKFVEWPDDTALTSPGPLVLAVVGNDPFGTALERATAGQSVNGRPVLVRRWHSARDLGPCHVLFVAVSDADDVKHILGEVRGNAVLTIGDRPSFVSEGGIIGFFMHDSRIRFDINPSTAERSHLRISSRLLAVAHVVQPGR